MASKDTVITLQMRLAHLRAMIEIVLPAMYNDPEYLKERIAFWESRRVEVEEKLYNLTHGDVPCRPSDLER